MPTCEACEQSLTPSQAVVTVEPGGDAMNQTAHVYCVNCAASDSLGLS